VLVRNHGPHNHEHAQLHSLRDNIYHSRNYLVTLSHVGQRRHLFLFTSIHRLNRSCSHARLMPQHVSGHSSQRLYLSRPNKGSSESLLTPHQDKYSLLFEQVMQRIWQGLLFLEGFWSISQRKLTLVIYVQKLFHHHEYAPVIPVFPNHSNHSRSLISNPG